MTSFSLRRSQKSSAPSSFSRNRRVKRRFTVESLESRTLLSYTFVYTNPNTVTVNESGGSDSFSVINNGSNLLEFSESGGPFSTDWGAVGNLVDASAATTVTVNITGDNSALNLGNATTAASVNFAAFITSMAANAANTVTIDDSASTAPSTTYTVASGTGPSFPITGPGINFQEPVGISNGGITLKGGSGVDTYNVVSTFANEPVTIAGGASIGNIVNVGSDPGTPSSSTLGNIHSLVTVNDTPGLMTLNLLDAGDTTSATGNITGSTVTGLGFGSGGSVAYAGGFLGGVTSLVIDGGTSADGDSGVTYNFTSTSTDTTLNDGPNADTVNITGTGVIAGSTLTINDDTNTIVNYDAGGGTPVVTAPTPLPVPPTNEVFIALAGSGTVDANGIAQLNITDLPPIPIIPGLPRTINTVEGFNLADAIVATFQSPLAAILPTGTGGPPAGDFTATIDWGDPSPDLAAGTITQDASNPSVYYVTGTHTFVDNGTYTVANTVDFVPVFPVSESLNGVTVNLTLSPSGPTTGNAATANVIQGPLAVSAFPIVGTEGLLIPAAPIATFIDAGGADPIGDYSATITVTNSAGTVVVSFPAASITQNADAAQYTVNAPAFTLREEGTYQVVVAVTDDASADPITASGASTAVIADAPLALTAAAQPKVSATEGINTGLVPVATFTDANPPPPTGSSTTADFTATIDWGDGSPTSLGLVTENLATDVYTVSGAHTYPEESTNLVPPTYTIVVNIVDDGGSRLTTTTTATVADATLSAPTQPTVAAVEGQPFSNVPVSYFIDPNPLGTVSDFSASIAWGSNANVATTTGVVQLIGHTAPGAPVSGILFEVLGSNTYTEEGSSTITVTINDVGGATTLPTTTTATTVDAPLTSSNGTEITGIEGQTPPPTVLLGTFTDANQGATIADFTTAPGSVVVKWGDGSTSTLAAANLTLNGLPDGVVFSVTAAHTYAEAGTYAYTVTVTDDGGAVTIFGGSAIIADAALTAPAQTPINTTEAAIFPVPVFAPPVFNSSTPPVTPVAIFNDGNPLATIADFTATIDWGDGTAPTAGTIVAPVAGTTAFQVYGSHTYADSGVNSATNGGLPGVFNIQVFVTDDDGSKLTVDNTANVTDNPIVLTGQLNPASDSGLSTGILDVTNVKQPDFYGTSEPFSHVTLFATALPSGAPVQIGQVQAGSDGAWNIKSVIGLTNGHYEIFATAVDQFGVTTTTAPTVITTDLLIDTTGPVIAGMFFNPLNGQVDYIIKNPVNPDGSAPSGVWVNTLLDSSNYLLTTVHAGKAYPGKWVVTNVTATADPTIANAYDVAVTFNGGAPIKGGYYLFTIRDSSNGHSSVQDLAENHLDGVFYGSFPSGNGINGSDFVAELEAVHGKVFAPQTVVGTAAAANGGVGGMPVAPVHSGIFVTALPRGANPIFSTSTSPGNAADPPVAGKLKRPVVVKAKHTVIAPKASIVKASLVKSNNHPKGPVHKK